MLLNIASDKPFIYENNNFIFFDRKELETQLPEFFYKNKEKISTMYVIHGPWYFSSTRVGVEVLNILKTLDVIHTLYYLDKLSFFAQCGEENIYLFSGNKNKFILWKNNEIVLKKDLDFSLYFEELFELKIESNNFIKYENIVKNYKNLSWNKLEENKLLRPYYIFEPIVS